MVLTLGCSVAELKVSPAYRQVPVVNIEDPLSPGYLDQDVQLDLDYLKTECRQRLVLDGPYIDLNLGSPEPRARRLAQEKALQALDYARQCRAEEVVFLSTFLPFIGLDYYERGWIEESIRSWREVVAQAGDVRISLGNTFEFEPANLLAVVEAVGDPRLGLAFDVGHCLVWGRLAPLDWYRRIRSRCRLIYLHSNDGQTDQHRSIRTGRLSEEGVLAALGHELHSNSIVILKYFDKAPLEADLAYLRSLWRLDGCD